MNENDTLWFFVSSSAIINVYVMTETQFNTVENTGGLVWEYEVLFENTTYVDYVFNAYLDNDYYVVFYNKGLFSVYIEYDMVYMPYNPYPYQDPFVFLMNLIVIAGQVGGYVTVIVLAIVLPIRHHQKKIKSRQVVQPKSYCVNCGCEKMDITSDYCSKCGSKINNI